MKSLVIAVAALFLSFAPAAVTRAQDPTPQEKKAFESIDEIDDAARQVVEYRKFLKTYPKSGYVAVAKRALLSALIEAKAPADQIVAATEDAASSASEGSVSRVYNRGAFALGERNEMLDKAREFATKSLAAVPADDADSRAMVQDTLGWIEYKRGNYVPAIDNLVEAAKTLGGDQDVLNHLAAAYEKAGRVDDAIATYIKSSAVYLGTDHSADAPLRALYLEKNGSLDGLEQRLNAAKDASRQYVVFDSRKWNKPAPDWQLVDLAGKPVKLSDFRGKYVVMDFWGSWCGPCRLELPKFQELANKYKSNADVVFLGMNWEQPGPAAERLKLVKDFVAKNQYTFPVVLDHDKVAVKSYELEGFPTVYIIDPSGMIRYRNLGYEDGVDQIIDAQIHSVMK